MSRARLLQFSLLFVGLALAPLALLLLSDFAGMDTLGLVMVLGAVCALPTVLDRLGGRFELFEAINVVCYFSFVQFGLATLYLLYNPPAAYDSRVLPYLNVSLLYCIIGFGSMVYGYFLVRRLGDVHHAPERVIRGSVWIAVLFGVGAAGQFAERLSEQQMYESSRVGGLVSAFCQLEQLALFGYFLLRDSETAPVRSRDSLRTPPSLLPSGQQVLLPDDPGPADRRLLVREEKAASRSSDRVRALGGLPRVSLLQHLPENKPPVLDDYADKHDRGYPIRAHTGGLRRRIALHGGAANGSDQLRGGHRP